MQPTTLPKKSGMMLPLAAIIIIVIVAAAAFLLASKPSNTSTTIISGSKQLPPGTYAYVPNLHSSYISVIATSNNSVVATIPISALGSSDTAATPNGAYLYATSASEGIVSVINISTGTVAAIINSGVNPVAVAVTQDGRYAYVTNFGDITPVNPSNSTISVIDTSDNKLVATVSAQMPWPNNPLISGGELYFVRGETANQIAVLNISTNKIVATFSTYQTVGAQSLAATSDGKYLYVLSDGSISIINTSSHLLAEKIPWSFNADPKYISIAPNGAYLCVADFGNANVSIVNLSTSTVVANISVGTPLQEFPSSCAITPDSRYIYASVDPSEVDVISAQSKSLVSRITVGTAPRIISFVQLK